MDSIITTKYSGSVKFHLKTLNFADDIPKHIIGFSSNYEFTKRRIEQYLDDLDTGDDEAAALEWKKWDSFSPLEQELFQSNIEQLRQQQASLQHTVLPAASAAARGKSTKRKATNNKNRGRKAPSKKAKSGVATMKQEPKEEEPPLSESSTSDEEDSSDSGSDSDDSDASHKKPSSWSKKESKKLLEAINSYNGGRIQWKVISERIFKRKWSSTACSQHYFKFIQPRLVITGKWDQKEDSFILKMQGKGKTFAQIAARMPGRNALLVRARHEHLIGLDGSKPNQLKNGHKPGRKPGRKPRGKKKRDYKFWTEEELKILRQNLDTVKENGSWEDLLPLLPNRSLNSITAKGNALKYSGGNDEEDTESSEDEENGSAVNPHWTKEEDEILLQNFDKLKEKHEDQLLVLLPGRTLNGARSHYHNVLKQRKDVKEEEDEESEEEEEVSPSPFHIKEDYENEEEDEDEDEEEEATQSQSIVKEEPNIPAPRVAAAASGLLGLMDEGSSPVQKGPIGYENIVYDI